MGCATTTTPVRPNSNTVPLTDPAPHKAWVGQQATPAPPPIIAQLSGQRQLGHFEVYIDDFCGVAQGGAWHRHRIHQILFDTLDHVFRPLKPDDSPHQTKPASVKKLLKGNGAWATHMHILGWLIDMVTSMLELPPHCHLQDLLVDKIPMTQKRVSVAKWHRVLGELRSMTFTIPGASGLVSHIQAALGTTDTSKRICTSHHVHTTLKDF